ncbi:MAG: DUF992 domain-containing protein [Proteobacteria bacterium]|nr:DUF992 domain-containing protein [Pseudomonadota bacterium]
MLPKKINTEFFKQISKNSHRGVSPNMKTQFKLLPLLCFIVVSLVFPVAWSEETGIKVGALYCKKAKGGYNILIHSVSPVKCRFVHGNDVEYYKGETGIGLGIDLEWDASKLLSFVVFSIGPKAPLNQHSLVGKYVGVKASAAAIVGMGAQVLVGGGGNNFTLQPLGLEDTIGLGAAAGLGYLYLEKDTR